MREESEEGGAWLVDGAHDRAALPRQRLQQLHALRARGTVQTTAGKSQILKYCNSKSDFGELTWSARRGT